MFSWERKEIKEQFEVSKNKPVLKVIMNTAGTVNISKAASHLYLIPIQTIDIYKTQMYDIKFHTFWHLFYCFDET